MKELVNSSQLTERASVSPEKSTDISETTTDGIVAGHTSESTAESEDATDNSSDALDIAEKVDIPSENEVDTQEKTDTSEGCGNEEHEATLTEAESEQRNSFNVSVESTQQKVRYCE